jgi:hypothetical protein
MNAFLRTVAGLVFGVLSGYDRLMFRGHLRRLSYPGGMHCYCNFNGVKLKEFQAHAQQQTERLIEASQQQAKRLGRPIEYLRSPQLRKEDYARKIATRDNITDGLIAVLSCVEPCSSFSLRGNRATKKLEFRSEVRKCLHLYHYYQHPLFGFMYARVQTWFPFAMQIGLNGREWLTRQLDAAGLSYRRHDNCVTWVEDMAQAQRLLDAQLRVNWPQLLNEVRARVHPSHPDLLGKFRGDYYWSLKQSEWASDVLFEKPSELQQRYGTWLRYALSNYKSVDVLRFLGRKLSGHCVDEVLSDLGRRVDGVRIKHRAGDNSIKMYDKAGGRVLRVETTINDPGDFKVFRTKEGDPEGEQQWLPMRQGVADLHRRAEVSQSANERYLEGLAAVNHDGALKEVSDQLGKRMKEPGAGSRKLRGLNPLCGADAALLEVVGRPEFTVNGLRNRDVVAGLFSKPATVAAEQKRRSAQVGRQLRLLRAHGIVRKVPKTHRYQVTERGRLILTAIHAARHASTEKLVGLAA